MYPLLISLLEIIKKAFKIILKNLAKHSNNNDLSGVNISKREFDQLTNLSSHLQKDIGLPPYTSRSNRGDLY